MLHLLKYRFLQTLRERSILFWALFFPLILGTFFNMAFGKYARNEDVETKIPVAIVETSNSKTSDYTASEKEFLESMQDENLIEIKDFANEKAAKKALKNDKINGIFYLGDALNLTITKSDLSSSILNMLLEGYNKNADMIKDIATEHPDKMPEALSALSDYQDAVELVAPSGKSTNSMIQYFFALIAYACLSGIYLGVRTTFDSQANLSALGARRSVSPTHKLKLILVDFITVFIVDLASVLILTAYVIKVIKIDLGGNTAGILTTIIMGSVIGVSIGIVVGASTKGSINAKMGLSIAFTLFPSFLAGLMFNNMSGLIEKYFPILNRINPAAVLADAFYCLRIYYNPARYSRDMITLLAMSIGFLTIAFLLLRRERYDSI
jgi:ABC-2 type transport system permease protein